MSYFRPNSADGIWLIASLRRELDAYDSGKREPHYSMPAIIYPDPLRDLLHRTIAPSA